MLDGVHTPTARATVAGGLACVRGFGLSHAYGSAGPGSASGMETRPESDRRDDEEARRGEQNEIGYRNVDEDQRHDERGTQGEGAGEPPAREQ